MEDGQLTVQMVKAMVYTSVWMMDLYLPGIISVVYAGTPPADAVDQCEQ